MDISSAVLFVVLAAVSMSYAWGMRGTIIGGEKGAMLPGAVMGMLIALFSSSEVLKDNFFMLSAVGAMSMYLGGCMTYGETLGLSMNSNPPENFKKSIIALVVKGFIWFSLFGAFVGIALNSFAGLLYTVKDFILIFALIPVCALAGYFLLNKPLDPKNGKFPFIYFSKTRQESWGGLLGILLVLVAVAAKNKDSFTLNLVLGAGLSGGIGWASAQTLQAAARLPLIKGKRLFEKMNRKKTIDAWKLMEYSLGAIGGIGIALTLIAQHDKFSAIAAAIDSRGAINLPLEKYSAVFTAVWLVLIALDQLQFIIKPRFSLSELKNQKIVKATLSESEYEKCLKDAERKESSPHFKRYAFLVEKGEFALYSLIPMFFVLCGSSLVGRLTSFFILYLVVVQEVVFGRFRLLKHRRLINTCLILGAVLILLYELALDTTFSMIATMIMYTIFYDILGILHVVPVEKDEKVKLGPFTMLNYCDLSVFGYMSVSGVVSVLLLALAIYF